jgi:hypothetical protein
MLLGYPAPYRERYGGELIGTLMEAYPSRRLPSLRESAGLLDAGLVTRVRTRLGEIPAWVAGLQLGVLLLALVQAGSLQLGSLLTTGHAAPAILLPPLLVVVPILLGRMGTAAVLALIQAALATYEGHLAAGWPYTRVEIVSSTMIQVQPLWGSVLWTLPGVLEAWVIAAGAVVLALRRRARGPLPRRSWWWLTLPLLQAVFTAYTNPLLPAGDHSWDHQPLRASLTALLVLPIIASTGFLLIALRATVETGDPRWAIAAGVYLLPTGILAAAFTLTQPAAVPTLDTALPAVLLAAACTAAALLRTIPPRAHR